METVTAASGILLVDKPQGLSSHDVVARVRRVMGTRKVGHAGTLDPMATGLLVVGVERATRLLGYIVGHDKEYEATIRLGASTDSDDADGTVTVRADTEVLGAVSDARIAAGIARLTGEIEQVPSRVSAIKVNGRRAYELARAGHEPELAPRAVTVSVFELRTALRPDSTTDPAWIDLDVRVECSSGTYVRALARDLGDFLGVGGHLTRLRRTRVGDFRLEQAVTLDALSGGTEAARKGAFLGLAEAASLIVPTVQVTTEEAVALGHGKKINLSREDTALCGAGFTRAALDPDGHLVAILEIVADGTARVVTGFPEQGKV